MPGEFCARSLPSGQASFLLPDSFAYRWCSFFGGDGLFGRATLRKRDLRDLSDRKGQPSLGSWISWVLSVLSVFLVLLVLLVLSVPCFLEIAPASPLLPN